MPLRSENGWSCDRSVIARYSLPGGEVALRKGDVSVVLLWCANRWHQTVEPLVWPGVWGYAERPVRGSTSTLSNHASGTAIDINAPQHPLGIDETKNFSDEEIRAVRSIVAHCEGVIRWGGDYSGRQDPMHLEIDAGSAAVRRIADKIRATATGKPSPRPRVTAPTLALGVHGPAVAALQRVLNAWYPRDLAPPLATDGVYGPATAAAVRLAQQRAGLPADGVVGAATRQLLQL